MYEAGILKNAGKNLKATTMNHKYPHKKTTSSVSFNKITIREYDRAIGDNPSCTSGCPISIGWSYSEEISFPFEVYESSRPPSRKKSQLQIPPSARTQILQLWDNSLSSIVKAAREAHAVRRSREKTAAALMRREILVHTIRGIFTFPLFLSYFCSQERKQVFHHEQNFTSTPKKVVVRESDRTKSEEETKSSDSDLSVLSEFEDPEAVADQSMNSNDFSIDSDDEGVFDDHFADGLSITYHRQICLD